MPHNLDMCPFLPEAQAGYTCDKGCDLREPRNCTLDGMLKCDAIEWTCDECRPEECELAYDPYNIDGACLMRK